MLLGAGRKAKMKPCKYCDVIRALNEFESKLFYLLKDTKELESQKNNLIKELEKFSNEVTNLFHKVQCNEK